MSFFDRLHNSWKLFSTSLDFVRRDKSLFIIPFLMLGTAFLTLLFFGGLIILYGRANFSQTGKYISGVFFLFFNILIQTFLGAAQAWMVYEVAKGKDTTLSSGLSRAAKNFWDIIQFAVIMLFIRLIGEQIGKRSGFLGRIAAGYFEAIVGIAGKLVLPAMIVTDRSLKDAVLQLKESMQALPEIATYEIGIGPLALLTLFAGFLVSLAFGMVFGIVLGVLLAVLIVISIIILSILIDQIYYTLVYLTLIEKKKVAGLVLVRA